MTLTSARGRNEDGFILLRGLLALFIVVLCFSALLGGFVIFTHRGANLLERAETEVLSRNETIKSLIK